MKMLIAKTSEYVNLVNLHSIALIALNFVHWGHYTNFNM